jgi:hypothetical protein
MNPCNGLDIGITSDMLQKKLRWSFQVVGPARAPRLNQQRQVSS